MNNTLCDQLAQIKGKISNEGPVEDVTGIRDFLNHKESLSMEISNATLIEHYLARHNIAVKYTSDINETDHIGPQIFCVPCFDKTGDKVKVSITDKKIVTQHVGIDKRIRQVEINVYLCPTCGPLGDTDVGYDNFHCREDELDLPADAIDWLNKHASEIDPVIDDAKMINDLDSGVYDNIWYDEDTPMISSLNTKDYGDLAKLTWLVGHLPMDAMVKAEAMFDADNDLRDYIIEICTPPNVPMSRMRFLGAMRAKRAKLEADRAFLRNHPEIRASIITDRNLWGYALIMNELPEQKLLEYKPITKEPIMCGKGKDIGKEMHIHYLPPTKLLQEGHVFCFTTNNGVFAGSARVINYTAEQATRAQETVKDLCSKAASFGYKILPSRNIVNECLTDTRLQKFPSYRACMIIFNRSASDYIEASHDLKNLVYPKVF